MISLDIIIDRCMDHIGLYRHAHETQKLIEDMLAELASGDLSDDLQVTGTDTLIDMLNKILFIYHACQDFKYMNSIQMLRTQESLAVIMGYRLISVIQYCKEVKSLYECL